MAAGQRGLRMQKDVTRWYTKCLEQDVQLVRWGHYGTPVLLFPTAGGDAEEILHTDECIGLLARVADRHRTPRWGCGKER